MGTSEIALLISAVVAVFGILTFAFARSGDNGKREYWEGQTTNQLAGIADDLKDVKAWQRVTDQRIAEIRDIAVRADEKAQTVSDRLDRAGIA